MQRATLKRFTSTAAPRFCIEASTSDPVERTGYERDNLAEYQSVATRAEAARFAHQYHQCGYWVEIYDLISKELIAGPFDPEQAMPAYVC